MKTSSCEVLLQFFPSVSENNDLHSTFILNCVFNNFLCHTAIMLNIATIYAIRKTSSLPRNFKTFLLSLAVSDVGVGLFAQPFYTLILSKCLQHNNPGCAMYKGFYNTGYLFSAASFFCVVAVSVDRFLAIHLHLRYQELVTYKRVVDVVISIWVLSAFVSLMALWIPQYINNVIVLIFGVICLVLTTMVYISIYLTVRRHKNQIQALQITQVEQTREMANFISLVKSAVGIFCVYLTFLVCYLPYVITLAAVQVNGPSVALKKLFLFSLTLIFLNSTLNPVIYCWKMRHIRHAIMNILRNMSWYRNRASHQSQGWPRYARINSCCC
ncbi:adenosine receptor A2b-like [Oculina patagonica]